MGRQLHHQHCGAEQERKIKMLIAPGVSAQRCRWARVESVVTVLWSAPACSPSLTFDFESNHAICVFLFLFNLYEVSFKINNRTFLSIKNSDNTVQERQNQAKAKGDDNKKRLFYGHPLFCLQFWTSGCTSGGAKSSRRAAFLHTYRCLSRLQPDGSRSLQVLCRTPQHRGTWSPA